MSNLYSIPSLKETSYEDGAERVVAKLHSMGIAVPPAVVAIPPGPHPNPLATMRRRCTQLEDALLERFDETDLRHAAALIHYQAPRADWHALHVLNYDFGFDFESLTLCPSLLDALGAVISACDDALVRLSSCRRESGAVVVTVGDRDVFRIERVKIEPFNLTRRDRVRTLFKGVWIGDFPAFVHRASRLPGFSQIRFANPLGGNQYLGEYCFLGFPANWAQSMRATLAAIGIAVKLCQAQELVAVFFGASSWHQLIKHQDDLHAALKPVALCHIVDDGVQAQFYHTAEEAIFAFSEAAKLHPEPLIIQDVSTRGKVKVRICATTLKQFEEQHARQRLPFAGEEAPSCLICEDLKCYSIANNAETEPAVRATAEQVLAALDTPSASASLEGGVYQQPGALGVLEAKFRRLGLTVMHLGQVGQHTVAVLQLKEVYGSQHLAQICVYRFKDDRLIKIADDALYKAKISYLPGVDGGTLSIKPDYGHKPTVLIPMASPSQVIPVLELARKHNPFSSFRQ